MCEFHFDLSISDREVRRVGMLQFLSCCNIPQKHSTKRHRLLAGLISLVWGCNGINVLLTKYCTKVWLLLERKKKLDSSKAKFAILFLKDFWCCVLLHSRMYFSKFPILPKSLQLFCYSGIINRGGFTSVFSIALFLRHSFSQALFWDSWKSFGIA